MAKIKTEFSPDELIELMNLLEAAGGFYEERGSDKEDVANDWIKKFEEILNHEGFMPHKGEWFQWEL